MTLPSQLVVAIILHPTVTHSERTFTIKRLSTHTHTSLSTRNVMFKQFGFFFVVGQTNVKLLNFSIRKVACSLSSDLARTLVGLDWLSMVVGEYSVYKIPTGGSGALFSPTSWLPSRLEKSPPALPPFLSSRYRRELGGAILFTQCFL